MAKRSVGSIKNELLTKAQESALCAIKIFNDPLVRFKSETFIVLMVIAWTYLLHAYYRSQKIEYRHFKMRGERKRFDRIRGGAYKFWELEKCLAYEHSPIDKEAKLNLLFLIGLRHEIEHQMSIGLDGLLSARYQACAINFNDYLKKLFGQQHGLDEHLSYSIQFTELTGDQFKVAAAPESLPDNLKTYIASFDAKLAPEEFNSSRFAYRLLFMKKLVNHKGQADKVVEFISPDSELAQVLDREYWVKQEVEKQKYRPTGVIERIKAAGFSKFRINPEHVDMWKGEDAKNPAKGYGAEVAGVWYWYESWVKRCIELCEAAGEKYR